MSDGSCISVDYVLPMCAPGRVGARFSSSNKDSAFPVVVSSVIVRDHSVELCAYVQ